MPLRAQRRPPQARYWFEIVSSKIKKGSDNRPTLTTFKNTRALSGAGRFSDAKFMRYHISRGGPPSRRIMLEEYPEAGCLSLIVGFALIITLSRWTSVLYPGARAPPRIRSVYVGNYIYTLNLTHAAHLDSPDDVVIPIFPPKSSMQIVLERCICCRGNYLRTRP
jgi:hypothetical protein